MKKILQQFAIRHTYPVFFVDGVFDDVNPLQKIFSEIEISSGSKFLFVLDDKVVSSHPQLIEKIKAFFTNSTFHLAGDPIIIPGGETCKNNFIYTEQILEAVNQYKIDRHAYVAGIGGGALLDVVGFASSIAHRGVRHIRIPTTVLSQNDSGVGVKNGINYFNKKNFTGTFSTPYAVINDQSFLKSLSDRDFRSGLAEAIKVGLVKDDSFFDFIENNIDPLNKREESVTAELIFKCAQIHLNHIASGDPFERGSSRPLDYGHWSAHKLESISNYEIRHGEAVVIGMCLDAIYANLKGLLNKNDVDRLIKMCRQLGFSLYTPEMEENILPGLEEFREHLGGRLTIMLLEAIGKGVEVHEMNNELIVKSVSDLKKINSKPEQARI